MLAIPSLKPAGRTTRRTLLSGALYSLVCLIVCFAVPARAQTGGQGALQGTITDPTGAVVPNAKVVATAQASGVKTTAVSSSGGLYSLTPLVPDLYTVTVTAPGFKVFTQKNIEVNGLNITGFNAALAVGLDTEVVTVTDAPPQLQTTQSGVGAVITDETYESLPIVMNGQQRDPTSVATLAPGAQAGSRAPLFSGTGNYLAEVYVNGIPTTTANQQGDNRVVSNGVPVESVDQLQVISSAPSAEYQGAGAIGFTIKSGGNQYHGQVVDFVRNTIFDTWGFAGNQQTKDVLVNGVITREPAGKPVEHQNEISASFGGPIPFTHKKGFFFVNYDKFHGTSGVQPAPFTIPTTLMTQGNFTQLGTGNYLYNPLTNSCTGNTCTRQPYMGLVNGVPTANVLPSTSISSISAYEQKFMPSPNLSGLVNNYLVGGLSGYNNHEIVANVAYDLFHGQRISFTYIHGVRQSIGYGATLPLPYTNGDSSDLAPTMLILEHSIPITDHLVNQLSYGFTRFTQPVLAPTAGLTQYSAATAGITGLPVGQASGNFPGTTFGTSTLFTTAPYEWTENGASDASHNVVPNAFTLVDNLSWTKGKHNMTFGFQTQWLEDNTSAQSTPSGIYTQAFAATSTAPYTGTSLDSTKGGYSYASFLLGAVNSGATSVPLFVETGGRFHPWSPYFQDNWQVRPNLTINLGLRWDYLPPYHEAQDRWAFFNPNATNPLTGSPGQLEYAGNRGAAISCQCRTPVNTYWKNWGPRLGLEWAADPKTVFRIGYALAYSRAGGVGGRAGDSTGTGQDGFGSSIVLNPAVNTGAAAGPSYYLNDSADFTAAGAANTNFGGPGYVIPTPAGPAASSLTLGIGNYLNSAGTYVSAGGAPAYADPYLSGRAPEFNFYNLAIQRAITNNLTVTVGYSGSESHFVAGAGVPGFWSGQVNPAVLPGLASVVGTDGKTPVLNLPATPGNVALAQAASSAVVLPYSSYVQTASGGNSTASIARMLRPYPQYSAPPSPEWDNIANISYNAFELTLKQREYKGVSFTLNYTYSRNIGDDGTTRSAFAVPAAASSSGVALPGNNRADRDIVATDTPQNLNVFGYVKSPFGANKLLGGNWFGRNLLGGWQISPIFSYYSGTPILVTGSGCSGELGSGATCMPDIVPGRQNSIRIHGGFGSHGVTYANYAQTPLLDSTAFQTLNYFPLPAGDTASPITKIGDSPRSHLNLWSPSHYDIDSAIQRQFNIPKTRMNFIFRAECFDCSNKVTFTMAQTQAVAAYYSGAQPGTPSPASANGSFGLLSGESGNRRWQFSGRVQF
ncbi:TonB-dependent receptor [Granulicella sp. 5B5]|nr:TonB-dependent receptor [Granulicella sp. 5B5]